jgi:cytochrome c oxidase cbb3-type subunit 3
MKKIFSLSLVALLCVVAVAAAISEAAPTTAAAADAKEIYNTKCVKCHGADGKGIKSLEPPDFTDAKWQASRKNTDFIAAINNGKNTMPGYKSTLKPADVAALVKMVRAFAPKPAAPAKKK